MTHTQLDTVCCRLLSCSTQAADGWNETGERQLGSGCWSKLKILRNVPLILLSRYYGQVIEIAQCAVWPLWRIVCRQRGEGLSNWSFQRRRLKQRRLTSCDGPPGLFFPTLSNSFKAFHMTNPFCMCLLSHLVMLSLVSQQQELFILALLFSLICFFF